MNVCLVSSLSLCERKTNNEIIIWVVARWRFLAMLALNALSE
jgi:hypothetical protein